MIFASKRTVKIYANIIKSYDKAYYVVPDSEQGGILQGKLISDFWNKNTYEIVMHLVNDSTRFDCVKYRCDDSGRIIELPFKEYSG